MTSTKLNAEELAAKEYPIDFNYPSGADIWRTTQEMQEARQIAYQRAVEEVAQPIADERDELREALEAIINQWDTPNWKLKESTGAIIGRGRAVLDKYPKP